MAKIKPLEVEREISVETLTEKPEGFVEYGIHPEDSNPYIVTRSFLLMVKFGPPQTIRKGLIVYLSKRSAEELFFSGRVEPLHLGKFFKAIRDFTSVENEEWCSISRGDLLQMDRPEAIKLLREGKIEEAPESESEVEK